MNISDKLLYTLLGYAFLILNVLLLSRGHPLTGVAFGFVGAGLFIKAIRTKQ